MAFLRAFNFSHGLTQPQLPPTLVDPFMGTAANVFQNGASTFNRPVLSPDKHDIQQHQLRQLEQLQQLEQFQQMQQQNEQLHRLQSRPRNRPSGTPRLRKPITKVENDGESDLTPSQQVGKKQQETLDDLIKEQLPSLFLTPSTTTTTTGNTHNLPAVTPIQGPIFLRNNTVPVVPLYSYPILNNGTLLQIPILWTALSVALGLEIRGEIIRGLPCIKRLNQLYCPTAGNRYPSDSIARFIDENKALIRRMYGEFQTSPDMASSSTSNTASGSTSSTEQGRRSVNKRQADLEKEDWSLPVFKVDPDIFDEEGNSFVGTILPQHNRTRRQSTRNNNQGTSNKVDACESTVEVVTPYWAANSAGKIRAIVNTQHFEQAIHQEVCQKTSTKRCFGECSCEQKYKWHRLLAYDPDNDCKGIFMDWFLFPSCCVCRCPPLP